MTKKEKIFYMQPVVSHHDSIVHRGITECLVLTLACLQQNTEHSPPSIHKRTDLHDVIFLLTSNILLIPVLLEILFFKESSEGSSNPKGKKNPSPKQPYKTATKTTSNSNTSFLALDEHYSPQKSKVGIYLA